MRDTRCGCVIVEILMTTESTKFSAAQTYVGMLDNEETLNKHNGAILGGIPNKIGLPILRHRRW